MTMVNYAAREINCKVVYYGPGAGGKTTTLEQIYHQVPSRERGALVSLATESERTLFFDFLPVEWGSVRGFTVRFHLYTVPGQPYYNASRKLILKGVDGLVFVADSQEARAEANLESMQNLFDNVAEFGYNLAEIPIVMQYNKRDLPDAAPIPALQELLNSGWIVWDPKRQEELADPRHPGEWLVTQTDGNTWLERAPYFQTVAITGEGVLETLHELARMVLENLSGEDRS